MRKFFILLKKEIRELLTAQVIAPLIITAVLFFFLGNLISKQQETLSLSTSVAVVDQDMSSLSNQFISILKNSKVTIQQYDKLLDKNSALETAKKENKTALIVIPEGFDESIGGNDVKKIEVYTIVKNFSLMGGRGYGSLMTAIAAANESFSNSLIEEKFVNADPANLKTPIKTDEFTVVGNRSANISPNLIMGFVSQQTAFIPVILFIVIIFAAQMIATAIANEKENKTLETLLTTPVSRKSIVVSKMAGAGIIALLSSLVYMFGFRSYVNSLTGTGQASGQIGSIIKELGLSLTPQSYILLALSLFAGIILALSISIILGAFAEDVKSVAGLITPLMVLVMIPYFLTMFLDINTLPSSLKYFAYAIPFSHVFLASSHLFLHEYPAVFWGIIYQLLWFIVFVLIAAKIFSTDKIVTMKLNFSKKNKN